MLAKPTLVSTTGLFVNYRAETPSAPAIFNAVSAKPDSEASISANKIVIYSDELIDKNAQSESQ